MNPGSGERSADGASLASPFGMPRREFVLAGLAAAAFPAAVGCGNEGPGGIGPKLSAQPGTPTVTPTTGLTRLGLASGRDGLLYVPTSYDPAVGTPLFVALHGAGGSSDGWESYHARAEARAMVLLIPDSRDGTWDLMLGGFGADVDFIDRALHFTFDRCRIDPARVALGGFSDGASYALSLGVPNGDLFTHLVAYSPGFMELTDPVGSPAVFVSHGTADPVLPVSASRDSIVPALRDAGYDVTYMEFAGGHAVPAEVSEAALDWFLDATGSAG
jgi:phospholipase/carboxylesterase